MRARGVMEKCTYCVQRLSGARRSAEKDNRPLRETDVTTACQDACPTRAITFGDLNDPDSRLPALRQEPQHFTLLGKLETKPRTTYLADIRNPPDATPATKGAARMSDSAASDARLLPPSPTLARITADICDPVGGKRPWRRWWIALAVTFPFVVMTVVALGRIAFEGVGTWGINTTSVWGFAIANYVWWIGVGNAGTLISSLLLLTRQEWRSSINRFAETMTLFAVSIAGIFPIVHLGRPQYFYWLAPYANTMTLWPQWRSALVWDFWAILSYLLFSCLFWYVGFVPDAATLRDRARSPAAKKFFGLLALGWRGSAAHWRVHKRLQLTMAALAVPLVCSVHSIVGLDFAASLMPGWQEPIFPPYFVVGAMYSGFAMVVVLAIAIRWGLRLQGYITLGISRAWRSSCSWPRSSWGRVTPPNGFRRGSAATVRNAVSSRSNSSALTRRFTGFCSSATSSSRSCCGSRPCAETSSCFSSSRWRSTSACGSSAFSSSGTRWRTATCRACVTSSSPRSPTG